MEVDGRESAMGQAPVGESIDAAHAKELGCRRRWGETQAEGGRGWVQTTNDGSGA